MIDELDTVYLETGMRNLLKAIRLDYYNYMVRARSDDQLDETQERMIQVFNESLTYEIGRKYAKVIKDGSVWGFVVAVGDDKKFAFGDILMAANYNTPARNSARGNIFGEYEVNWTGPKYLR
jgi:hypothetical protein